MDVIVMGLVELASVASLVQLWRGERPLSRKVLCSIPVLIPVIGPLLYIGLPDVQPESLQAQTTSGD